MPKFTMPEMEKSFEVSVVGEATGELYKGKFTYKKPNLGKIRQIRCTKAALNEDFKNLDEEQLFMNEMLSWLSHTLLEHPTWWVNSGWDLYDYNVVVEIWSEVLIFEKSFKGKIEKQGEEVEKAPKKP